MRHVIAHMSPYSVNYLNPRNPWVAAWWSAAFPGLGHIMLCKYMVAVVLIGWEVFINNESGVNTAIYYSMLGEFEKAKDALDLRWLYFYMPVYVFAIWDSYHRTVQFNAAYKLASKTGFKVTARNVDTFELNTLMKRKPTTVAIWSLLAPGVGYLHINRLPSAILFVSWFVALLYFSSALPAIHATMLGDFAATKDMNIQWLLYVPSLYGFVLYDAYAHTVEYNKFFCYEQAAYLNRNYKHHEFVMPI